MAEPFKDRIGPDAIAWLAQACVRAWPAFPAERFQREAADGLEALELSARVGLIADALRRALPDEWTQSLVVLLGALPPAPPDGGAVSHGFSWWPILRVVEVYGADEPEASLPALREMTGRFSAEFAIRPLIDRHPEPTWAALQRWVTDPDEHVRRLVSEGTRPRLPWGRRLADAVADPSRGLALLDRLVDDPSPYVRRSVANHLGDVAKDHPDRAVAVASRWLRERPDREPLVRHALRTLLKRGHGGALALLGQDGRASVEGLSVHPVVARAGEVVTVHAELRGAAMEGVRVDVVWSWPGAHGRWSSRVFRARLRQVDGRWELHHRLSLRPVTTRPLRPGEQRVQIRVAGQDSDPVSFTLLA